ncbi:hypothetical protein G4B88_012343 [Cannabis sativa]|uniref:Zinc knuckle CX2CX4HX4C domain-containing protein n=1 Tax=Cannabis sativa TaxID=3483 RepID=A0A7J6I6A8_CANSA|nr:hypothetical protein G4B88_012343 [Cannabis sativa]
MALWSPCGGFMLVCPMHDDGRWQSTDLKSMEIWVRALGVPTRFMADAGAVTMASWLGTCIHACPVRKGGLIVNEYLRFRVCINLEVPLMAGASLLDEGHNKIWAYFKYERLLLFCFKCGWIGHEEALCSGKKRMLCLDDGRSMSFYGPWLRLGSRIENSFSLLEAEDIDTRDRMKRDLRPKVISHLWSIVEHALVGTPLIAEALAEDGSNRQRMTLAKENVQQSANQIVGGHRTDNGMGMPSCQKE